MNNFYVLEKFGPKVANIYRLAIVSILLLLLVTFFFFIMVTYKSDIIVQGASFAVIALALWFITKYERSMFNAIDHKKKLNSK